MGRESDFFTSTVSLSISPFPTLLFLAIRCPEAFGLTDRWSQPLAVAMS